MSRIPPLLSVCYALLAMAAIMMCAQVSHGVPTEDECLRDESLATAALSTFVSRIFVCELETGDSNYNSFEYNCTDECKAGIAATATAAGGCMVHESFGDKVFASIRLLADAGASRALPCMH